MAVRNDTEPAGRDELPTPPKALTRKGGKLYVGDPVPGSTRGDALASPPDRAVDTNYGRLDREKPLVAAIRKLAHDGFRGDGWANLLAGLGGKHDKRNQTYFGEFEILLDRELERMYFADGVGTRIVDVVADDMTREWINLKPDDDDDSDDRTDLKTIEEVLEALDARSKFNEALKWTRLYGGAVMVMGALDGQTLDQPLRSNSITSIDNIRIIDRSNIDVFQSTFQLDPTQPNFGKPIQLYMYFQVGTMRFPQLVHISRCIMFKGKPVSAGASVTLTLQQRIWGLSELQCVYETLKDYGANMDNVSNTLYELVIGKYRLDGLKEMMAAGQEAQVQSRMEIMNTAKSVLHAVLIDKDDDYTRDTLSLAGVSDIIDRFEQKLCCVSGIPMTRLFGMSPGGLNSTGEHDQANYYDLIASHQETQLKPALREFIEFIKAWKGLKSTILVEFNPLFQESDGEKATRELAEAQAQAAKATMYSAYMTTGVLQPEEVYALEWAEKLKDVEVESWAPTAEQEAAQAALEAIKEGLIATPAGSTAASGGASPSLQTPPSTEITSAPQGTKEAPNTPAQKQGSQSQGLVPSNQLGAGKAVGQKPAAGKTPPAQGPAPSRETVQAGGKRPKEPTKPAAGGKKKDGDDDEERHRADTFDPDQPRGSDGKWGSGGEGSTSTGSASKTQDAQVKDMASTLKGMGDRPKIIAAHQMEHDPDLAAINKDGKEYTEMAKVKLPASMTRDEECHWNVAKAFAAGKIDSIVVGYGQNNQGWHQHTWGLKDGKVVETTMENTINDRWFGKILSTKESSAFVANCAANKPGKGMVRTIAGGSLSQLVAKYSNKDTDVVEEENKGNPDYIPPKGEGTSLN